MRTPTDTAEIFFAWQGAIIFLAEIMGKQYNGDRRSKLQWEMKKFVRMSPNERRRT